MPQFSSRRWRYSAAARALCRHRRSRVLRAAAAGAHALLDALENVQFDPEHDGEHELLRRLATLRDNPVRTVLDVGSNEGAWTAAAVGHLAGAVSHCFEIDPGTRAAAHAALSGLRERVVVAGAGLDQVAGRLQYVYVPAEPALTGLFDIHGDARRDRREAVVITGDEYVSTAGITTVDLLKIDVEGAEGRVLDGFARTLAEDRVRVVQFEYGLVNVAARSWLADMYERFPGHEIGRLFPDGVRFEPFKLTDEQFRGGNYVAVRRSEPALVDLLRCADKRR